MDHIPQLDFPTVHESLLRSVSLCLDSDPSLIPLSSLPSNSPRSQQTTFGETEDQERDPDDFSFWSDRQARRICEVIKQTFDVDIAPEVVMADANVTALANRILLAKEMLKPTT